MRTSWLILGSVLLASAAQAQAVQRPVVLELFTSEGCSSCPPADALLAEFAGDRPDVLPLSFHVTYWNGLGWKDPFSLEAATERQQRYVAEAVSPEVYTPALVVDGRLDAVGSDRPAVAAAVRKAQLDAAPAVPVQLSRTPAGLAVMLGNGTSREGPASPAAVLLVGYDRQHETHVGRGENGGRTLVEANVVRSIATIGTWTGRTQRLDAPLPPGELAAVLVQAADGRILGAAKLPPSS